MFTLPMLFKTLYQPLYRLLIHLNVSVANIVEKDQTAPLGVNTVYLHAKIRP